jgi:hypothetical protein
MSDKKAVDQFKEYAEQKLKNHLAELHTRYENESAGSETLKKGFDDHKNIYTNELDQKIKDMRNNNDDDISQLDQLKSDYVNKLSQSNLRR